jgi:metallo-beta-lactamase family protein
MKLTFLGATGTVTGSKYLLEHENQQILLDCGLFQGFKPLRLKNWTALPLDPEKLTAVILTHAHIDHSGYVPKLVKLGFKGPVYCTAGTAELCKILLPDSGHIQEEDAARANRYGYSKHHPALPLYTERQARESLSFFKAVPFGQVQTLGPLQFSFHHAGHILGAAFVRIVAESGTSLLFSGDLGRPTDPLMRPPAQIQPADYLVVESTYGNRRHEQSDPQQLLGQIICETVARGGTVVIPAFAVGRAQLILYYLYQLREAGVLSKNLPIFLDSPMAINASESLHHHSADHRLSRQMSEAVCRVARYTRSVEESKAIYTDVGNDGPKVVISASGMATGGRVLHHLKQTLSDTRNTIVMAGYQAGGTRGDRLLKGESTLKIHGEAIPVRAQVASLCNLSAHADYVEILEWLRLLPSAPREVFVVHGEPEAAAHLREQISTQLQWPCRVPAYGDQVELS